MRRREHVGEGGFSLVELLVTISILGVVGFGITEALIVGMKTTDSTTNDIAGAVNIQTLKSHFTGDAQSAKLVSTKDPAASPCTSSTEVFLHLSWTDQDDRDRAVSYSFEADATPVSGERDLVRWSCTDGVADSKRDLGHFSFDPIAPLPVQALCDGAPCPEAPAGPATVTMRILTSQPGEPPTYIDLTVRRRST